jgi:hypothetical protein
MKLFDYKKAELKKLYEECGDEDNGVNNSL